MEKLKAKLTMYLQTADYSNLTDVRMYNKIWEQTLIQANT